MDPISILGYANGSPYRNRPFLDIQTPEGSITMANTAIDLLGIDNLGNVKKMKAGRKNPYKFPGNQVREIPMQQGGLMSYNPYLAASDKGFQQWYNTNTLEGKSGIPFSDKLDYDYYSYFRNGNIYKGGHFPDTFKRPNHATFSDESIYSVPENKGGHWMGEKFIPAMQAGGKPPIYTQNPNDPRIKAYNDSLSIYNSGQQDLIREGAVNNPLLTISQAAAALGKKWNESPSFGKIHLEKGQREDMMPIGYRQTSDNYYRPQFKAPVQPVVQMAPRGNPNITIKNEPDYPQNPPIYTNNKNDRRLQMYKDSMTLYNGTKGSMQMTDEEVTKSRLKYIPGFDEAGQRLSDANNHQGPDFVRFSGARGEFKRPIQPIKYRDLQLDHQDIPISKPDLTTDTGARQADYKSLPQPNYTNPTKYSLTYPIPGNNNQQTMYFPDKETWKRYSELAKGVSSQEGSDYGTSTGYFKKGGSNPYQQGGMSSKALFDFIFDDEDEPKPKSQNMPTAPTTDEVDMHAQVDELDQQKRAFADQQNDALAMSIVNDSGNPYASGSNIPQSGNPYKGQILSSGEFKDQNVGEYGKEIYGQLANDLGYAPTVNSIYRSKQQNDALIASGAPAVKNSWHLTGNAIDLKPLDWHKLSDEQQHFYRTNYDVIYHNNHYHIEPK